MNEDTNVDLTIYKDGFNELKEEANELGRERYKSDDNPDNFYEFEGLWLDFSEELVDGNELKISGILKTQEDKDVGFISVKVPLDLTKLIDIFQGYIKKLNKVKTVMESVKDE